jgi:hypothetical protein
MGGPEAGQILVNASRSRGILGVGVGCGFSAVVGEKPISPQQRCSVAVTVLLNLLACFGCRPYVGSVGMSPPPKSDSWRLRDTERRKRMGEEEGGRGE